MADYFQPIQEQCEYGAKAPIVSAFVERELAMDWNIPELIDLSDFTFEKETVRTESVVARIEVFSNMPPPKRYFCPYSTVRLGPLLKKKSSLGKRI